MSGGMGGMDGTPSDTARVIISDSTEDTREATSGTGAGTPPTPTFDTTAAADTTGNIALGTVVDITFPVTTQVTPDT